MTDLALLMTGVLATGQLPPSIALQLPLVQPDNDEEKLTQRQPSQIVSAAQITPPEFVQSDIAAQVATSVIAIKNESILNFAEKNILYEISFHISRAKNFQIARKDTTKDVIKETRCFDVCAKPEMLLSFNPIPQLVADWRNTIRNFHKSPLKESKKMMLASTYFMKFQIASDTSPREVFRQRKQGLTGKSSYQMVSQINTGPSLPALRFGSSGVAVRVLQQLLSSNGYTIRVDGVFGALTEAAVKAFQNKQNLTADGIVGQRTWYELTK